MTQIHIVGTAHVSEKSIREVLETVERVHPEVIAIELDPGRYAALKQQMREEDAAKAAAAAEAAKLAEEAAKTETSAADAETAADTAAAVPAPASAADSSLFVSTGSSEYVQAATASDVSAAEAPAKSSVPFVKVEVTPVQEKKAPEVKKLLSGNFTIMIVQWLLAYVQRKIGFNVGVEPGAEMKAAIRIAEERGIRIALIDRDINITLTRFWKSMRFTEKCKLIWALVSSVAGKDDETDAIDAQTVDSMTQGDVLEQALEEFKKFSPSGSHALITERDAYLAHGIIDIEKAPFENAVVVCGAGHVPGITRYREHPETLPSLASLKALPKKYPWGKILGVLVMAMVVITITAIGFSGATDMLVWAIIFWILINGVLAGIGTLAARGHPASAATAAGLAWMTSLNPFLACGWFAALVEAKLRPPSVGDFKRISKAESLKEMVSVPLFRILLVAALANVGSILGTVCFFVFLTPVLGVDVDMMKEILITGFTNLWNWIISPFVQ
ncbi:MAG TPA: TraB/GumN family protein [Methanocorpusculum sp.]|nr:TraB/GumN family protein [Methanocorpusculum sp.]